MHEMDLIGKLQANALANASTFPIPADQHRRPHPRHRLQEHAHPIYQVDRVYLITWRPVSANP
jgi:hypothetical protein